MGSLVFAKKELLPETKLIQTKNISFGNYGFPNKGAISIEITCYDSSLIFVNCHLPSGWERENAKVRSKKCDLIMDWIDLEEYDYVVWSGDFNFRVFNDWISDKSVIQIEEMNSLKE